MAKTVSLGSISSFMNKEYDKQKKNKKIDRKQLKVAATSLVPLTFLPHITGYAAQPETITAASVLSGGTMSAITHALDPVIQLLTAISFPVASIIMVGGCFFFMFGNSEKAWNTITSAGLGYILIQMAPLFLKVLEQIGNAV